MSALDHVREAIDRERHRLRGAIPTDREAAILALIRAQDRAQPAPGAEQPPDIVSGRHRPNLGGNRALQLCLEATEDGAPASSPAIEADWDTWAERFRTACTRLAEAELVLGHAETGFMQVVDAPSTRFTKHGAPPLRGLPVAPPPLRGRGVLRRGTAHEPESG